MKSSLPPLPPTVGEVAGWLLVVGAKAVSWVRLLPSPGLGVELRGVLDEGREKWVFRDVASENSVLNLLREAWRDMVATLKR